MDEGCVICETSGVNLYHGLCSGCLAEVHKEMYDMLRFVELDVDSFLKEYGDPATTNWQARKTKIRKLLDRIEGKTEIQCIRCSACSIELDPHSTIGFYQRKWFCEPCFDDAMKEERMK